MVNSLLISFKTLICRHSLPCFLCIYSLCVYPAMFSHVHLHIMIIVCEIKPRENHLVILHIDDCACCIRQVLVYLMFHTHSKHVCSQRFLSTYQYGLRSSLMNHSVITRSISNTPKSRVFPRCSREQQQYGVFRKLISKLANTIFSRWRLPRKGGKFALLFFNVMYIPISIN